jgi:hypothetical protein
MYNSDEDGKIVYEIEKRYSEFKNVFLNIKDYLPLDYKFPNKSIFNNSSQFTKERRMRGFEELLHLMQRVESLRDELHFFLELDHHIGLTRAKHQQQHTQQIHLRSSSAASNNTSSQQSEADLQFASSTPGPSSSSSFSAAAAAAAAAYAHAHSHDTASLPSHYTALASKGENALQTDAIATAARGTGNVPDELRVRKSLQAVSQFLLRQERQAEEHFLAPSSAATETPSTSSSTSTPAATMASANVGGVSVARGSKRTSVGANVDEGIRQNPKQYLFFAAKVSASTYIVVVLLGIVDISNAGLSQIILTLLALFLLVLLLRIRYERGLSRPPLPPPAASASSVSSSHASAQQQHQHQKKKVQ